METSVASKRKLIDIKQPVFDALSLEASRRKLSLKRYIEELLEDASRSSNAISGGYSPAVARLIGSAVPKGKGRDLNDDRLRYLLSK